MNKQTLLNIAFIGLSVLPMFGFSQDNRIILATLTAFFIGLIGLYNGEMKLNNKWVIGIILSLLLTYKFGFRNINSVYLEVMAYVLMFACLSKKEALNSLNCLIWCGLGLSIYAILQFFGFESVYMIDAKNLHAIATPSFGVCATMGHPTYLGALLACLVPLAIWKKFYKTAALMVIAVFMTQSDMAIGSMLVSLVSYVFLKSKKLFIGGLVFGIIILGFIVVNFSTIRPLIGDSGRFNEWAKINDTIKTGLVLKNQIGQEIQKKTNLLGFGSGSFKKIYYTKENKYDYAHNEYLQMYFEFGIICLGLVLGFLFMQMYGGENVFIKMSILCLGLNALGLFIWQIGFTRFIMMYILCLNKGE